MVFGSPEDLEHGRTLDSDICVMGAGAAGITLALELDNSGLDVLLLEGGAFDPPPFDDTHPYAGESVGRPYNLLTTRLRYFGGSTNHWGGWCMPLDAVDFHSRAFIPLSGWPFERSELEPYYARAEKICEIEPPGFDLEKLPGGIEATREFLGIWDPDFTMKLLRYSPPTRFGTRYRSRVGGSKQVRCFLDSTVVEMEGTPGSISRVRVRSGDKQFFVRSRAYVVALGAIENARLLLCSDGANRDGFGNDSGFVGRCFADHVGSRRIGQILLPSQSPYRRLLDLGEFRVMPHLSFGDEFLEAHELVNCGMVLSDVWRPVEAFTDGYFEDARLFPEWKGRKPGRFDLKIRVETTPNPESRLTLLEIRDANAMRRIKLDWRVNSIEFDTMERISGLLGRKLGRIGLGRFRPLGSREARRKKPRYSSHHMGTTRMSANPKDGVTRADCRVHSVENLYVAGSSVFPTFGFANPTLTIVALAIRLADRLKRRFA